MDLLLTTGVDSSNLSIGLRYEASRGINHFVKKVLDYNLDQADQSGETAFYEAAVTGHVAVVDTFASSSPVFDHLGKTDHRTADYGRTDLVIATQHLCWLSQNGRS